MTIEIKVPDIGADEVEVTEILVKIGDIVKIEQSLIIVEGDKASVEVPSPDAGIVKEIKISVGDKVRTGKLIMIFDSISNEIVTTTTTQQQYGGNLNTVITPITDTASTCITESITTHVDTLKLEKSEFTKNEVYIHATPLVRRLARELDINLKKIKGTGRKGRILREDVLVYIKNAIKNAENIPTITKNDVVPGLLPWPQVDFSQFGETEEVKLSRIQKISGANLSRNWVTIPHVTHFDKTDITNLEDFRKQQNKEAKENNSDLKITPVVFIMKAVAAALEQMPFFNSSLSVDNQHLLLKKYINIGIAVDTPSGLVVPVFKNVNKKSITELSRELTMISKKAREGRLTNNEMQGGCFTISSIGSLGTTYFTPIINAPEVAILGISKSIIEPVWNGKEFMPRLMLPISLSFDHRVIDGADGARFITIISNMLNDIRRLIM